jgi:hypothetical protein
VYRVETIGELDGLTGATLPAPPDPGWSLDSGVVVLVSAVGLASFGFWLYKRHKKGGR